MNKPCTHEIVQEAMRIVSKDVRTPKYVRDMNEIPIAEEFYKQITGCVINHKDIKISMIEFAKLHVEAALKEASENAYFITRDHDMYNREYLKYIDIDSNNTEGDTFCYGGSIIINEDSILNAYPLNNIK